MVNERTVDRRGTTRCHPEVILGLEPLGDDALVEGRVEDLSMGGLRAIVPSLLHERGRAFAVITPTGQLPIVAMIEVVGQTLIAADGTVELRARFVELSAPNRDRLRELCAPDTSNLAC